MTSTGISLEPEEMAKLRILMRGDRRSLGWLAREAIALYLQTRADDVARYSAQWDMQQNQQRLAASAGPAKATGSVETAEPVKLPGHQPTSNQQAPVGPADSTQNNGLTGETQ
jgi:predicted transcriptional regulator